MKEKILNIFLQIWQFQEESTILTFANTSTNYSPFSVKFALQIQSWPFRSLKNSLSLTLSLSSSSPSSSSSCPSESKKDYTNNLKWFTVSTGGVSLYPSFSTFLFNFIFLFFSILPTPFSLQIIFLFFIVINIWAIFKQSDGRWIDSIGQLLSRRRQFCYCLPPSFLGKCRYSLFLSLFPSLALLSPISSFISLSPSLSTSPHSTLFLPFSPPTVLSLKYQLTYLFFLFQLWILATAYYSEKMIVQKNQQKGKKIINALWKQQFQLWQFLQYQLWYVFILLFSFYFFSYFLILFFCCRLLCCFCPAFDLRYE